MWSWTGYGRPRCALCNKQLGWHNYYPTCGGCFQTHQDILQMGRNAMYYEHQQQWPLEDWEEEPEKCCKRRKSRKSRKSKGELAK